MSINRVNISGNLTRDPELRATQGGTQILSMGVAVNDRRRNPQTGEWEDYPNFVDCIVFGNRAEPLSKFLHKGTKVAIEGKLRWSQWERDGQKRSKIEIIVDEVEFLSPQQNQGTGYQQQAPQGYQQHQQGYAQPQQSYQQPQAPQHAPQGYAAPPQQPAPQAYQQPPQGYAQPAPAPQAPQAPAYPQQPQYAPQQPPQQPTAPQQMQMPAQQPMTTAPAIDVYDEDITF